ncbi:hypothetical protein KSF78_0008854 [Schistosoma japonicum]|nr:hypothetical protein KSF78_0008854 [Schistosoma japonicum]
MNLCQFQLATVIVSSLNLIQTNFCVTLTGTKTNVIYKIRECYGSRNTMRLMKSTMFCHFSSYSVSQQSLSKPNFFKTKFIVVMKHIFQTFDSAITSRLK